MHDKYYISSLLIQSSEECSDRCQGECLLCWDKKTAYKTESFYCSLISVLQTTMNVLHLQIS